MRANRGNKIRALCKAGRIAAGENGGLSVQLDVRLANKENIKKVRTEKVEKLSQQLQNIVKLLSGSDGMCL